MALKTQLRNNVTPTDTNNKIKNNYEFNSANLIIYNNFSPATRYLSTKNVVYKFKFLLRKCFFSKVINSIELTTIILLRRLTLHLYDTGLFLNISNIFVSLIQIQTNSN